MSIEKSFSLDTRNKSPPSAAADGGFGFMVSQQVRSRRSYWWIFLLHIRFATACLHTVHLDVGEVQLFYQVRGFLMVLPLDVQVDA